MILLIDTVSKKIRLAFGDKTDEREPEKQSTELPEMVRKILGHAQPDAIGVVTGPGSFTGIRLGLAFTKGLAMGYGIPVVGISIFDFFNDKILAIDSGRGDYFIRENGDYRIERELPTGAQMIADYDIRIGADIVSEKLRAGNLMPAIPHYIRPSYVG